MRGAACESGARRTVSYGERPTAGANEADGPFSAACWRLAAEGGPGERAPADDERQTAERSDGAEPALTGEREQIEAAREDHRPGHEEPAGRHGGGAGPAAHRPRRGEQRERVVHV